MVKSSLEESHGLMSPSSDLDLNELESSHLKPNIPRRSSASASDVSMNTRTDRRMGSTGGRLLGLRLNFKQVRLLIGLALIAVLSLSVYLFWNRRRPPPIPYYTPHEAPGLVPSHPPAQPPSSSTPSQGLKWNKPPGFKIVALVFYGRPRYVNILDCYLKKNLVTRGGYLDEVRFMMNTRNEEDIKWLDELITTDPLYRKVETAEKGGHFNNIWNRHATDKDTMYIKIDDDVVYVHEDAIPRMVHTLIDHPEAHDVAANIVNSPLAHWLNYHTEAVLPYLPETGVPPPHNGTRTWRASKLPRYPDDAKLADKWEFPEKPKGGFKIGEKGGPPYKNHRWLPMQATSENLMKTPIAAGAAYDPWGKAWVQWTMAAQQHYSLLEHMEMGTTDKYWAGNKDGVWNMQYTRYNLNFLAIWGTSVAMMNVGADDEDALTVENPKALKRPCIVDTHAIISHFQFGPQPELGNTDLLERYQAYANEMVCELDNQRSDLDPKFLRTHE